MTHATACVLSFNRPDFLRTAISSLLENANAELELIVHDDGSTDPKVYELLYGWQQAGVISTLITNPPGHNQGQGVALNRMFGMASGDPIIKLDQDLIFKPDWLRRTNEILAKGCPDIGLLGLLHYWADPVDSRHTMIDDYGDFTTRTHILGSGFALTRRVWEELGPFEEHSDAFAEDWVMQRKVTDSADYACALPPDDLVINQGMGIGPSTVVVGEGQVQTIHKHPLIH